MSIISNAAKRYIEWTEMQLRRIKDKEDENKALVGISFMIIILKFTGFILSLFVFKQEILVHVMRNTRRFHNS